MKEPSLFPEIRYGTATAIHIPPVAVNPVDDRERLRRSELREQNESALRRMSEAVSAKTRAVSRGQDEPACLTGSVFSWKNE